MKPAKTRNSLKSRVRCGVNLSILSPYFYLTTALIALVTRLFVLVLMGLFEKLITYAPMMATLQLIAQACTLSTKEASVIEIELIA